jgi:hypothetical protein
MEKTTYWVAEYFIHLTQYFSGDKIEKNEMGRAYSAYGGGEKRVEDFGGETWEEKTTVEIQA